MRATVASVVLTFALSSSTAAARRPLAQPSGDDEGSADTSADEQEPTADEFESTLTSRDKRESERLSFWEAPPSCIGLEELREDVERQLSADPEVEREVRGEMIRGPAGWIVTLSVYESSDRLGERLLELTGDDCRNHDETLALVVALLLEHGAPPEPAPVESPEIEEAAPEPQVEPEPEASPDEPEVSPDQVERSVFFRSGLGVVLFTGWFPTSAWGVSSFVGARWFETVAVDLRGDLLLPNRTDFDSITVASSGGRVHLRGCAVPRWDRVGLSVCTGLGWMGLAARGRDVGAPRSVLFGAAETALSAAGSFHFSPRWAFELATEGIAPFKRGRFVVETPAGDELVHRTSPIIFSAHVGVVLTL